MIFLKKIRKLAIFVGFLPFCCILLVAHFFFKIRFYDIHYFIGAATFLDTYFIDKKTNRYLGYIDFFAFAELTKFKDLSRNDINIFWSKLLSRKLCYITLDNPKIFILKNKILFFTFKIIKFYSLNKLIVPIGWPMIVPIKSHFITGFTAKMNNPLSTSDDEKYFLKYNNKPHIILDDNDLEKCSKKFEKIKKLNHNNLRIISFNNRDGAFKRKILPTTDMSYHNYRNWDFEDYTKTLEYACKKYFVIRSGNVVEKRSNFKNQNFFEYSNSEFVSPDLDHYIIYKSKFYVGANGGLDKFARLSHIPVLYINDSHFTCSSIWMKKCISLPKKLFDTKKKLYVSFKQMADKNYKLSKSTSLPLGFYTSTKEYDEANIKIICNSQDEILSSFQEMELFCDHKLKLSEEDIKLQTKFWNIFDKPFNDLNNFIISPSFLKNNQQLLY